MPVLQPLGGQSIRNVGPGLRTRAPTCSLRPLFSHSVHAVLLLLEQENKTRQIYNEKKMGFFFPVCNNTKCLFKAR